MCHFPAFSIFDLTITVAKKKSNSDIANSWPLTFAETIVLLYETLPSCIMTFDFDVYGLRVYPTPRITKPLYEIHV